MERTLEEELMTGFAQAQAYSNADFEEPHARVVELFDEEFPGAMIFGDILDLGCGPGDITLRFARRFPDANITAIDGSEAMIELANARMAATGGVRATVTFIEGVIPDLPIPKADYDLIVSTNCLHHLKDPSVLWRGIAEAAGKDTFIFIYDLFRPGSEAAARHLVEKYSADEPDILKRDFYNSLLAAFTPIEVEAQLKEAGFIELLVQQVSDRHMVISGVKE